MTKIFVLFLFLSLHTPVFSLPSVSHPPLSPTFLKWLRLYHRHPSSFPRRLYSFPPRVPGHLMDLWHFKPWTAQLLDRNLCRVGHTRRRRSLPVQSINQHRSYYICWTITDAWGQQLNKTCNTSLVSSYFPTLTFDFAEMILGATAYRNPKDTSSIPSHSIVNSYDLYVCPGHIYDADHTYNCGGVGDYFCKAWSCVSTGSISWTPPQKNDFINLARARSSPPCLAGDSWAGGWSKCNPVIVTFTAKGKAASVPWNIGLKWGGRLYAAGSDYGGIFYIQRHVFIPSVGPIGPNKNIKSTFLEQPLSTPDNPLLSLIQSSYEVLNATTNYTKEPCWLCLSAEPPFYDATGSAEPIRNSTSDSSCRWSNSSITITSISGQGCCLGHIPSNYSQYCLNSSTGQHKCELYLPSSRSDVYGGNGKNVPGYMQVYTTVQSANLTKRLKGQYFIPGNNSIWACSTGATACVSGDVLIATNSFCIQVLLIPRIEYYTDMDFISIMEPEEYHIRTKREVVTALTLSVLLGLGAAGASTGIASLVVGQQQLTRLSSEIDADLRRIEVSISALQTSLSSLAEVALQNRRGLDLLFLKQGGLCAALKEECCFYADTSGIVTDSMIQLRDRLKNRERERQSHMSWYQDLFNFSPWLTTLLSALIGPLVLLLLACIIGPCVMGRIIQFLKNRFQALDSEVTSTRRDLNLLHSLLSVQSDPCKQPLLHISSESESDTEFDPSPKGLVLCLDRLGS